MKKIFIATALLITISCSSKSNAGDNENSTSKVAGNSDGANTIGADTTHMDTSLRRITTDSAK